MSDETVEAAPPIEPEPLPVPEPTIEELRAKEFPGKINFANERGHFSGCRAITFFGKTLVELDEEVNKYFEANSNRLVVEIAPMPSPDGYAVQYVFTKVMTNQEIQEFDELNREVKQLIANRRDAEAKAADDAAERQRESEKKAKLEAIAKDKERKVWEEKGRRCDKNHGKLVKMEREKK
jgi:hypothetical protein